MPPISVWGTISGIVVVVVILAASYLFMKRMRKANREVRERRHDPHASTRADAETDGRDRRDIPQ